MSVTNLDLNVLPEDNRSGRRSEGYDYVGELCMDHKLVSQIAVRHLPISLPNILIFSKIEPAAYFPLDHLPAFELLPHHVPGVLPDQRQEWKKFLSFLNERKVVLIPVSGWELIGKPSGTSPPDERTPLRVCYRKHITNKASDQQMSPIINRQVAPRRDMKPRGEVLDPPVGGSGQRLVANLAEHPRPNAYSGHVPVAPMSLARRSVGLMHPSYLRTLAQTHASWAFGGLAELVDNARDANATRLNISIGMVKMKRSEDIIPMLRVEDNGSGMTHTDIVRMLSFGHSPSVDQNNDRIGHFGVGFKSGSMKIGSDVVVMTQCESSRSIGFLSTSYNADKEVLEVPIVTYRKVHGIMELDLSVQSEAEGQACLDAVKRYSPFSEFEIGSLFEKIADGDSKNGTHIFIYNLEKWGSEYTLEWDAEDGRPREHKDITIRSKRVRTRPGQTSQEIPMDYSLRSYLEVLFLDPRMSIRIQGSRVKSERLGMSLSKSKRQEGKVLGKQAQLTLGLAKVEYKRGNCGIFMYWHGRLIEAYKRVGGMVHSADMGRGVVGVIDVTPFLDDKDGRIGVLNSKQGFEDTAEYAVLEKWLGEEFNHYWYKHFDNLKVVDVGPQFEPDREWVQCDKCRKWRKLPKGVHTEDLPEEWFCYFQPFDGTCKDTEEEAEEDVVTVGVNRTSAVNVAIVKEPVFISKGENLEDDVELDHCSPVVPSRRQPTRKNGQSSSSSSQPSARSRVSETMLRKADGKRVGSVSPPRRRLRRRS